MGRGGGGGHTHPAPSFQFSGFAIDQNKQHDELRNAVGLRPAIWTRGPHFVNAKQG